MTEQKKVIYTIGHSTRSIEEFVAMLQAFSVNVLADVRSFPGSRRYPHFNREFLQNALPNVGIEYIHFKNLGGRRKPVENSHNTRWRNAAFQGYADYMETDEFKEPISRLQELAARKHVAYMCSEAVWWSCHRSLISDYLKIRGWTVRNIMGIGKAEEHPFTSAARIVEGKLSYEGDPKE